MKRGFVVAVGGAAIVIAGLSGCSSDENKSESPATPAEATTGAGTAGATAAPSGGEHRVAIDGQDQNVSGTVVCSAMGGNMNIAIGDATTGIAAVVSEGDAPEVKSVGLGNVNGITLGYQQDQGVPEGVNWSEAEATKDGSTYKISGTATGIDMANPLQPVYKPFEIHVTCP